MLLGISPKDFDIATSALPEEVKRVFRNCRLIGRRFRLAHVFFGREIIEVATFRAMSAPEGEAVRSSPRRPISTTTLEDDLDDELDDDDRRGRREHGARRGRAAPEGLSRRTAAGGARSFASRGRGQRRRRRRPRHRRTRPHPARQRLRQHRRRRLAPRFHRQLALLQHRGLLDLGLHRRRRGHRRAAPQADRRSGHALSRGPGAHAARGAFRGQARIHARRRNRHRDRRACANC